LIRYEPLPVPDEFTANAFDWILFTSPQSACAFFDSSLSADLGEACPHLGALGRGTARELEARGYRDALNSDARNGAEFAEFFAGSVAPPAAVLFPGAAERSDGPFEFLEKAGYRVKRLPLYRTLPVPPEDLPEAPFEETDLVIFASPSAVRSFHAAYGGVPIRCAVIGRATLQAAREAGLDPVMAAKPDLESLCKAARLDLEVNEPSKFGGKPDGNR
jgi:uroporphyrinogen-III synthase